MIDSLLRQLKNSVYALSAVEAKEDVKTIRSSARRRRHRFVSDFLKFNLEPNRDKSEISLECVVAWSS